MVIKQLPADCVSSILVVATLCSSLFGCIQPSESADLPPSFTAWLPAAQGVDGGALAADDASPSAPEFGDGADQPVFEGRDAGGGVAPVPQVADGGSGQPVSNEPHPTTLNFEVLTKEQGGRYAPRNIGAIWIENGSGEWIKTLAVWAGVRERHLERYRAASGGNRVDAVTRATLWFHESHRVTWDLKDGSHQPVPDGDYRVVVELTDRSGTGASIEVPFTAGTSPFELSPPDEQYYVQMKLSYQ